MKYYKNLDGEVFAYETKAERQQYGTADLMEMTAEEIDAHINPEPIQPPVPQQITNAQGAAALIQAGLWQSVLDFVDAMTDPTERQLAEVALHRTTHWQRSSPFLNTAAASLGLTSEQLDDLFRQAAAIQL